MTGYTRRKQNNTQNLDVAFCECADLLRKLHFPFFHKAIFMQSATHKFSCHHSFILYIARPLFFWQPFYEVCILLLLLLVREKCNVQSSGKLSLAPHSKCCKLYL